MQRPSEQTVSDHFGRRVAECREERGLTQQQLAEELGAAVKWVQEVEGGRQNVTLSSITRIANTVGVEVRVLFDPPRSARRKPGRPKKA